MVIHASQSSCAISKPAQLALLIAALCHDIDHDGESPSRSALDAELPPPDLDTVRVLSGMIGVQIEHQVLRCVVSAESAA